MWHVAGCVGNKIHDCRLNSIKLNLFTISSTIHWLLISSSSNHRYVVWMNSWQEGLKNWILVMYCFTQCWQNWWVSWLSSWNEFWHSIRWIWLGYGERRGNRQRRIERVMKRGAVVLRRKWKTTCRISIKDGVLKTMQQGLTSQMYDNLVFNHMGILKR